MQKIDEHAGIRSSGRTQTLLNFGTMKGKKGSGKLKCEIAKLNCDSINIVVNLTIKNCDVIKNLTGLQIHKLVVQCLS